MPDLIWGGDNHCEHRWDEKIRTGEIYDTKTGGSGSAVRQAGKVSKVLIPSAFCSLCGAWRGAYGLEPSPSMYVQHTVEILREIRRVLRPDGVVFLNIGDSYAANRSYQVTDNKWVDVGNNMPSRVPYGLKPKDLCLIPFRLAIALQSDGWWCRSVIIWNKPNPMPESVTDRCSESHEYILHLTKSAKYYWDAEAVREKATYPDRWGNHNKIYDESQKDSLDGSYSGRNLRSVWTFPTQPYPEAHFATYPEKLVEICVKAATPEIGCCSKCGKPWVRVIEKNPLNVRSHKLVKGKVKDAVDGNNPDMAVGGGFSRTGVQFEWQVQTLGWKPQCQCGLPQSENIGSVVLDCFGGAGTTALVATKLGRRSITYELSKQYCDLIVDRNRQGSLV